MDPRRKAKQDADKVNRATAKKAQKKVAAQREAARARNRRSSPLVIKNIETGEIIAEHKDGRLPKPLTSRQRSYIRRLRREMGIDIETMPETTREGARVIEALLHRRATMKLGRGRGSATA